MLDFKKYLVIGIVCAAAIAIFIYILHISTNTSGFSGNSSFKDKLLMDYKKQYLPPKYQNKKISEKDIMKNAGKDYGF